MNHHTRLDFARRVPRGVHRMSDELRLRMIRYMYVNRLSRAALAKQTGICASTIKVWMANGLLPEAHHEKIARLVGYVEAA